MNSKIKDLITVFLVQLVLTLPFYTINAYGLSISNVRVTKVTSDSAVVEWQTDNLSNGKVGYGKTQALGFTQRHDNFIGNHTLTLVNGIDSDTAYFFVVESTDLAGNTALDNNSNKYYTFKTTDVTPPPQVTGLKALSTTSSSVFLSWNVVNVSDLKHYVVYRNRVPVANVITNSLNDTNLSSNTDFNYKVSAIDNSSNEGVLSDTLIASTSAIDSSAPIISNADVLPTTDTTAKVTWLTDEKSTSIVLYGINATDKEKSLKELVTNHTIVIDGLVKNLKHLFVVKSCDSSNNCANSSVQSFIAGKDVTPPFINFSVSKFGVLIPRFVNRRVIDIVGSTEPFSSVALFVNDLRVPKKVLSSSEIGGSGKFVFTQIQLEQDNTLKIVITDKSGNKNEKTFQVSVDTEAPIVQLKDMPSLVSKPNITISGNVNEPVVIKVFVDAIVNLSAQGVALSQITGLNATKIGQNSVEIKWDEVKDTDFSHYVVYRNGIGAIALTKPTNFNFFIDALVDSGKSYTYQVSYVNIFGRESKKSEPITVTTLKGGVILNLQPPVVDIFEDFRKPFLIVNASGSFNFGVRLSKDGAYNIKLIFEDMAENSVVLDKSVTLDTKKPEIKIISPPSGAFIFENVANEVDVIGKTEPNARVHLFIDRTPFSFFNATFEISGLPNEVQDIPEAQIDAKCRLNVAAKSFCPTGADFSVTADSEGNFKFEKVDLTEIFGGAARLRETPVTEFRDIQLNEEAREAKSTTLVLIATDAAGQRGTATQAVRIGTCWSGNQSWDVIPITHRQSPTFISTERLTEGTETIYFYFNYSYIGRGTNAKIITTSLSRACGTRELLDPRFNISCQILPSGNSPVKLNKPDNTLSYSAITLTRLPGMEKFLEQDWKSFFKAVNNELTFPFRVRITYEHEIIDENGVQKKGRETQTTCEQVSFVIDNSVIDPRKVLPDWLLFNFVDFLQDSIKTLSDAQKQIDKVLDYVAIGCLTSFGLQFIIQSVRRIVTIWEEKAYAILNSKTIGQLTNFMSLGKITLNPANKEDQEYCTKLVENIVNKRGNFKLRYVTDSDLKKCFPRSAEWWSREATVYSWSRWSCDRVFGHAAPSGWTYNKDDNQLLTKISSGEGCAVDQSVRGQGLKAESCRTLVETTFKQLDKEKFSLDDKCFFVQKEGKKALFRLGNPVEGKLYEIEQMTRLTEIDVKYAVKRNEFNFITASSKSCDEICGIKPQTTKKRLVLEGEKQASLVTGAKGNEVGAFCDTVDKCVSLNARDTNKKFLDPDGKYHDVKSAERRGYTSDCFYQPGDSVDVVSDSPSLREECCCINAKEGLPSKYYQPDDRDIVDEAKFVHESRSSPGELPKLQENDAKGYSDMRWSYRYWKERFEAKGNDGNIHKEYNPYRYIKERDQSACFGQNNIIYDGFNFDDGNVLTVDPFRDHFAAFQCVHLAGVSNRIQFIKNLMVSMSTCLIQVRTTGRGDTGACKELFTQHLCGAIWQVIRAFIDGCAPIGLGIDFERSDDNIVEYLRSGFKGVYGSIADLQSQIANEYGNAKLNELLGTGEESIARKICLGAFGYDWDINLRNIVDAAYATPFATFVQPVTKSREFLTVDPITLKPKYEYRASWLINPGCDFERYDVQLVCVGQKQLNQYPNSINCGALGAPSIAYTGPLGKSVAYSQCDCINLPDEKPGDLVATGRLRQNILEDKKAFHKVIESNVRYDHLKFVLRPDRKITAKIKPNCFPQGFEDGIFYFPLIDKTARDITDCTVQPASGLFTCGNATAFSSRGVAELIEVTINGENANKVTQLKVGDRLEVGARVTKTGKDKCLRVSISPDPIQPVYTGITLDGVNDIPSIVLTSELKVAGRTGNVIARGITFSLIAQNNQDIVRIGVKFLDENKNKIYDTNDKVFIDGTEIQLTEQGGGEEKPYTVGNAKIRVKEKIIRIEKEGAVIEIRDVAYQQTIANGDYGLQEVITISPPQQATETAQTKTLTVEIFHLRDESDSYNNPEDCNLNDRVLEPRTYRLTVSEKGVDVRERGPVIQPPRVTPTRPPIGQVVTISTKITHPEGIKNAVITIVAPDNSKIEEEMPRDGDDFKFDFDTSGREKGKYNANIKAISRTDKVSDKSFEFELVEPKSS